jgi:hypothetical protein
LGNPVNRTGNTLFYYSPFRVKERTASLAVTNKYITDFGTNEKYDIISFTSKLMNINVLEATKVLAKEFNIPIDNDYTSRQVEILRRRIEEKRIIENVVNTWYSNKYISFCNLYRYWNDLCEDTKFQVVGVDNLQLMYYNRDYYEYLVDTFANATEQDKVMLYKQRERYNKYENDGHIQFCSNRGRKG